MTRFVLLAGAATMALSSGAALAQTAAPETPSVGIADIVVTAQKREEKLQNVPIAITAIGSASLERQNVRSVADLSKLSVPGLTTTELLGAPVLALNIRGISTSDVEQVTIEQGVALYVDGVYIARSQGLGGDLVDIERVEVLRGPQGTLFGRNAEGGAVSFVSKKPTGKFGGRIEGEIGDFGDRRGFFHLDLPEVANVAIKLNGFKQVFDGYTKNAPLAPGQVLDQHVNFGHKNNLGGSVQALWTPSSAFNALFTYDRSHLRNSPDYAYNDLPTIGNSQPDPEHYAVSPIALYNEDYKDDISGESLVLTYDVADKVQLKSITARRHLNDAGGHQLGYAIAFPLDAFGTEGAGIFATRSAIDKTFSQELQLVGTAGDFQYAVGAFYFNERALTKYANYFTIIIPAGTAGFSMNPIPIDNGGSVQSIETDAFAVYGQTTWAPSSLGSKLKLTVGGRYTDDRKTGERTIDPNGVPLVPPLRPADARAARFDPAVTVAYQLQDAINVYARYAQAFRSGGFTISSPTFSSYGPETNRQAELGVKSEFFDRRLRLDVAAYHSWVKDQQINEALLSDPTAQEIVNAVGVTRIRGIELEATVAPVTGLVIAGNLALQSAKQPVYFCGGCTERRYPNLPKTAAGFNADYTLPLSGPTNLIFHVDYQYKSNYSVAPLTFAGQTHPFSHANVWNGRVALDSFDIGPTKLKVAGYVENIFNTHEIVFETNFVYQARRAPRQFGVSVEAGF